MEELKSGHDKNAEKLLEEFSDLKVRNQELEANIWLNASLKRIVSKSSKNKAMLRSTRSRTSL